MSKNLTNQQYLRVNSLSINNITINAPLNSTYTLTLPTTVGTANQVLTTIGNGVLAWQTAGSLPGVGSVTSVSASVPTFLSVSVTNPTTTPNVAITYSGTALPVANGGTGLIAVGANNTILTVVAGAPTWQAPATSGTVTSVAATVPAFLSIAGTPITASGTLAIGFSGTALPIANGGTGTTTSTGSGAVVLATSPTLVAPTIGAASGTSLSLSGNLIASNVIGLSVNAAGNTAISSLGAFLQWNRSGGNGETWLINQAGAGNDPGIRFGRSTAANVVTETMRISDAGVLNITGLTASSSVATDASKNLVSVANTGTGNNVLATSPTLVTPNIGLATGTGLLNSTFGSAGSFGRNNGILNTNSAVGQSSAFYVGNDFSAGNAANINFSLGATNAANSIAVGNFWGSGGSTLTLYNSIAIPATLNAPLTITGTLTATNFNSTALTASSAVATDASKNLVSVATVGTGSYVLATSPTLVTPNLGAASANTLSLGVLSDGSFKIAYYGVPPNNFQYDGIGLTASTIKYQTYSASGNHTFYAGTSSTTENELFRIRGTGGFLSSGNSTVNGIVTISSLTASSAVATDASKNLVSVANTGTGNNVLSNGPTFAGFNSTGNAQITGGNFTMAGGTFYSNNIVPPSGNIVTVSASIVATPLWGSVFQSADQAVGSNSETFAQSLTNTVGNTSPPGLTLTSTRYTNSTGRSISVLFSYSVFWDPAFGGGVVQASIRKNGALNYGGSTGQVFATTYFTSCTGSCIIALNNTDYVELWIRNNLGGTLSIKGGSEGGQSISQMHYKILN